MYGMHQLSKEKFLASVMLGTCLLAIGTGCASRTEIALDIDLPQPLIQSLPIRAGIYYAPELDQFVFEEKIQGIGSYKIELKNTQSKMFRTAFGALLDDVVPIDSFDTQPPGLDVLIVPRVMEFQISVPQQSRTQHYEVWLRYAVELYTPKGQQIHNWGFAAYGKVNAQNYQMLSNTSAHALEDAATWALRDAVATISFFFVKEPRIKNWMDTLNQG